jgi:hypothetical protein
MRDSQCGLARALSARREDRHRDEREKFAAANLVALSGHVERASKCLLLTDERTSCGCAAMLPLVLGFFGSFRIANPRIARKPFMRRIAVRAVGLPEKHRARAEDRCVDICAGGNCLPGS